MNLDTTILALASLFLAILLWLWHTDKDTPFDLTALFIDSRTKRVSLMKVGQAIAMLTSTWVLIYETRQARLSEWLFIGYMVAWSGANLANKAISRSAGTAQKMDTSGGSNVRE
jgi:hypothetical protein